MGSLQGKVAIVTGAGQGVGRGIAVAFAKEGAKVIIAEINPETCKAATKEIKDLGTEALGLVCDVGDEQQVRKMVQEAVGKFGTVDILVNNAQGLFPPCKLEELEEKDWDLSFQTGVKATWYCCKAVFPYMRDRGGKIINFGSEGGITGVVGRVSYNANKEAIRGFSRTAAREWGRYKINVNVICPIALTPALGDWADPSSDKFKRYVESTIPLRRAGDPEKDIGRVAVFLASEDSDFITGQTFLVDGGVHMF
jgi:NAD(P)-dependent dehydrogenase (short-subunit alcohol dehydrogenase family)